MRYCNYWGLVVPDKNIVKDGELPDSWGMFVAQKNRLKCVKPCPKLDPLPMSLRMLTALAYAIDQRGTEWTQRRSGKHGMRDTKRDQREQTLLTMKTV